MQFWTAGGSNCESQFWESAGAPSIPDKHSTDLSCSPWPQEAEHFNFENFSWFKTKFFGFSVFSYLRPTSGAPNVSGIARPQGAILPIQGNFQFFAIFWSDFDAQNFFFCSFQSTNQLAVLFSDSASVGTLKNFKSFTFGGPFLPYFNLHLTTARRPIRKDNRYECISALPRAFLKCHFGGICSAAPFVGNYSCIELRGIVDLRRRNANNPTIEKSSIRKLDSPASGIGFRSPVCWKIRNFRRRLFDLFPGSTKRPWTASRSHTWRYT